MNRALQSILCSVLALALALATSASAAIISAPVVQNITSNADTALVLNTGTYVSGKNVGNANIDSTINGVLFKKMTSGFLYEGGTNTPGTIRYIAGTAASGIYPSSPAASYFPEFAEVLNSTDFNGANEAIVGLDPLKTYRVQMLSGDNRAFNSTLNYDIYAGTGNYTQIAGIIASFGTTGVGTGTGANKTGFIATFTFNGFSAINIQGASPQGFISGISVYDITAIPEPGTYAMLCCLGLSAWEFKRHRSSKAKYVLSEATA